MSGVPAGSMARPPNISRRDRPWAGLADSLARFPLPGCPIAGGWENESTDSARGGNMGLSMVMGRLSGLRLVTAGTPATGWHREGDNIARDDARRPFPEGYCIAAA